MFGYAEKEKVPPVHKPSVRLSVRRSARPALPPVAASHSSPIKYKTFKSPCGGEVKLRRPVSSPPKITLYGEFITLPEDWSEGFMNELIQIIKQAATNHNHQIDITDDQFDVLKKNLTEKLASTSPEDPNKPELLSVLFEQMKENAIPLSADFINEIKQGCKLYVTRHQKESTTDSETDSAITSVTLFLLKWSNFDTDSSMEGINPRDYLYKDMSDVMWLLDIDEVSRTGSSVAQDDEAKDDEAEKRRIKAATLIHGQLKKNLTADQLRKILLDLNWIFSPQTIQPYKQGLRYHHAQIGQGRDAIGTTPAMEVEESVTQVIKKIVGNLAPCESLLQKSESLSDEMLKKVIATSAMAYQLLISIHPFSDGNGRTCRMFANYILMRYGLLPATFSEDSAKLSMYADNKKPKESNAAFPLEATTDTEMIDALATFPPEATTSMIKALATSLDKLRSRPSSQTPKR